MQRGSQFDRHSARVSGALHGANLNRHPLLTTVRDKIPGEAAHSADCTTGPGSYLDFDPDSGVGTFQSAASCLIQCSPIGNCAELNDRGINCRLEAPSDLTGSLPAD